LNLQEFFEFLLRLDVKLLGVVIDVAYQPRDPLALYAAGTSREEGMHR